MTSVEELVERLLNGDRRAVSRLISMVENDMSHAAEVMRLVYPHTGQAHIIGVTGPPGSGKSTLVDRMILEFRGDGATVGVIAVDASSPFTGGALLGDRIRMHDGATDKNVFIRSMGTRGNIGGLSRATNDAVKILDAFGKDYVIIETVGTGQDEVDVVNAAHTSVVVEVPGLGDDIQAIKAGIFEIGDVFVVNKADLDGADRTCKDIEMMLEMAQKPQEGEMWNPPVLQTVARDGTGVREVLDAVRDHMRYLKEGDLLRAQEENRARVQLMEIMKSAIAESVMSTLSASGQYDDIVRRIAAREVDPHSAAEMLLRTAQT